MNRQLSMVWAAEAEVMQEAVIQDEGRARNNPEKYLAQLSYKKVVNLCSKILPCKDSSPITGQVSSGLRKCWHSATPDTFSSYTH